MTPVHLVLASIFGTLPGTWIENGCAYCGGREVLCKQGHRQVGERCRAPYCFGTLDSSSKHVATALMGRGSAFSLRHHLLLGLYEDSEGPSTCFRRSVASGGDRVGARSSRKGSGDESPKLGNALEVLYSFTLSNDCLEPVARGHGPGSQP